VPFVPVGVEARVMRNGTLLHARVFATGEEALKEAEEERTRTLEGGDPD